GIAEQVDANNSVTISLAYFAINYVPIYLAKRTAGLNAIEYDVQQYLLAALDYQDPHASAEEAEWNEQKNIDTSKMDTGTSAINALIENVKSEAQANEVDLQNAIASQDPINNLLKSVLHLLAKIGGGS
ncbi:MAG: hypothetical protein KGI83_04855, partial [Verrucomicrobiota bacterium]|nr:hypothetical protein [Verrucomicrobiota bacterium]